MELTDVVSTCTAGALPWAASLPPLPAGLMTLVPCWHPSGHRGHTVPSVAMKTHHRPVSITRGTVVVNLHPTVGHERDGLRPCVVVSDEIVATDQRFPLICVIPVTGTPGTGTLYPSLAPGPSGLRKQSYALIDHVGSIDKQRVVQVHGVLTDGELTAIDRGLRLYLEL